MTRSTLQRLRLMLVLLVASAAAGSLYSLLVRPPDSTPLRQIVSGGLVGTVISACITGFELFGAARPLGRGGRRLPFLTAILVRAPAYGALIVATLLLMPTVVSGDPPDLFRPGIVRDITFSVLATFLFVFLMSIAQLIGPGVLLSVVSGRYYQPREEDRIVLFLDLVGSTGIAEEMGSVRFLGMLSDTFTLLSKVVTNFGGEVHRYVGDSLIATWPVDEPESNARPVLCLLACHDALREQAPRLRARHGLVPAFRASLHAGPLAAGEIGGFKREIALLGDAMNTTARIEQISRATGHDILVSGAYLDGTALPSGMVARSTGHHQLRGKSDGIELFVLAQVADAGAAGTRDASSRSAIRRTA